MNNGAAVWLRSIGATVSAAGTGVAAVSDAQGKFGVMVTGKLGDKAFSGTPCAVTSSSGASSLVARLDNAKGDCVWSKSFAGESAGLAVDGSGDLVVTGTFTGSTGFDATSLLTSGPGKASFVAKLGSIAGDHLWSRGFIVGSSGDEIAARAVASDQSSGHWIVAGTLDGTTDFGAGPPLTAAKGGFLVHLGN